jgi:peroxiredoxin
MNKRLKSLLCLALAFMLPAFVNAAEQGDPVPDCLLKSFANSETLSLKKLQGQVLYIDFWASWCGPCAKSFPFLNGLHAGLKNQGLTIIGVNMDENQQDAHDFLAKYPASFPIAADVQEQCAKAFAVQAMPSSYLIDRKGVIRHIHLGFKPGEAEALKRLAVGLLAGQ